MRRRENVKTFSNVKTYLVHSIRTYSDSTLYTVNLFGLAAHAL